MKANAVKSIRALAIAAVTLAIAPAGVGAANSGQDLAPDDRSGLHGPAGIESQLPVRDLAPDDRAGQHGPGGIQASAASDDTAAGAADASAPTYVRVVVDGFDWSSAGVGAGAAAGAIIALIGAVLFVRSGRARTQTT